VNDFFRKVIENVLPILVEEAVTRRVVYWLYWLTTACTAWLFIATNPVFGWVVVLPPVLLVGLTSRVGLSRVPGPLLTVVLALALIPAFFLGQAQASEDTPTGFVLAGLLIFLVWVAAFPTMVKHVDRHRREKRAEPRDDPFVDYRVTLVRLWMAAVIMAVVGESFAALVCVAALLYRRKWTAVAAGLACLVFPLLTNSGATILWDAEPIDVVAAVISAYSWYGAMRNPHWGVVSLPAWESR
jgi:hypothetical protein